MAPRKAFPLRLDPALYEALERGAAAEFRSVNAQVEMLLREGLRRRGVKLAEPDKRRRGRPPKEE
ncbi:hypothetical protein ASE85_15370 [Sphingobium sp. Leaf26]|nr:hypothetical protein ASE85_15370 [Sphingobium sp. Leaf26]